MLTTSAMAAFYVCASTGLAAAAKPVVTIGSEHELFVDDHCIEKMTDLVRRVVPATKYKDNPVLAADKPWEMQGVLAFPSVCYDEQRKIFRMWYLVYNVWWSRNAKRPDGSAPTSAPTSKPTTTATSATTTTGAATSAPAPTAATRAFQYYQGKKLPNKIGAVPMADSAFICYAESADGLKWIKPELGIHEFQGSKKNNIVLRHHGSHFDSFAVIRRCDWPKPEERYILIVFVGNWPYDPKQIAKLGLKYGVPAAGHYAFCSADGIHFKPRGEKPVTPLSLSQDRTTWSWDPRRKLLIGNWKWYENKRRCRRQSESKDLATWSPPRLILIPDKVDAPDAEFYGHYGFCCGSQYLGWLELYRPGPGTIDFQLISSRDGQNWDRVADRGVLVPRGGKGAFDQTMILIPGSPPIRRGNELWIYYEGSAVHHNDRGPEKAAIGMARTRVDGFVAVEAAEKEGTLVTKLVALKAGRLFINASVAAKGSIRAEVTQPDGKVLPGFEAAKALPVTADSLTSPLSWRGDPALPTGRALRLVFHLKSARLYAYWCQ